MKLSLDFFNTRGHATRFIWCDNGINLKAGSKALTSSFEGVKWKGVVNKWSAHGISWHHIPPIAPSKGGKWERMVDLAKNLTAAIAARKYYRSITTEELCTYFKEVEGIFNCHSVEQQHGLRLPVAHKSVELSCGSVSSPQPYR